MIVSSWAQGRREGKENGLFLDEFPLFFSSSFYSEKTRLSLNITIMPERWLARLSLSVRFSTKVELRFHKGAKVWLMLTLLFHTLQWTDSNLFSTLIARHAPPHSLTLDNGKTHVMKPIRGSRSPFIKRPRWCCFLSAQVRNKLSDPPWAWKNPVLLKVSRQLLPRRPWMARPTLNGHTRASSEAAAATRASEPQ